LYNHADGFPHWHRGAGSGHCQALLEWLLLLELLLLELLLLELLLREGLHLLLLLHPHLRLHTHLSHLRLHLLILHRNLAQRWLLLLWKPLYLRSRLHLHMLL
jgi:hypothetical protein